MQMVSLFQNKIINACQPLLLTQTDNDSGATDQENEFVPSMTSKFLVARNVSELIFVSEKKPNETSFDLLSSHYASLKSLNKVSIINNDYFNGIRSQLEKQK